MKVTPPKVGSRLRWEESRQNRRLTGISLPTEPCHSSDAAKTLWLLVPRASITAEGGAAEPRGAPAGGSFN
jgi:hypothetical protein